MFASQTLAAQGSASFFLIVAGFVVVALLIGAFWYGTRRAANRKTPGARPAGHGPEAAPRQGSWTTPDESGDGQTRR
ncbi:DUF6479 family protein [Streptomyces liliifuscus]|uniref:Secreted protein n=1 Tax=Streptomyces liliifuscus TaxID=2797636 RepID=A0A7T7HZY8_9ACTN|nr:DUF6479 family protein [Streptomyces liliifuscus]QQM38486.1 hypothetical protein JEQ17_02700 [Streptomyces liliifuscus]